MIQQAGNSQTLTVALVTVGVDRDLTDRIVQAASQLPWSLTHENFDEYLSATRRAAISGNKKR